MREVIKSKHDLCTGCNRCVRECPMETANITYQDEHGDIKVKIDYAKCIACGRCITACKHDARTYEDDAGLFFRDLKNGVPISLIAAPAIRTNIPEYRKLFTYLKRLGVNKIYDVSLGADICIWGYVRYCEKTGGKPIITQPCPVIVTYIEQYRHDLLEYLAPVQGPMASLCIYMKQYEGITDSIAAISPCVAKAHEFESTGLSQYNVTFPKLLEYIRDNEIELPDEETGFDNYQCGLGSLFPMPGGLKENIEFFTGKSLSIDRAEGYNVYEKLNMYASSGESALPNVFDVLNCEEGCNIGTACSHSLNLFEINRKMDANRTLATGTREDEYFHNLYKEYDDMFDLSLFLRTYKPGAAPFQDVSDSDIETAFNLLNKTTEEKQNVDCGACGSETCYNMARKIAYGVNIPINCIVKAMEDAKQEHTEKLAAREQLAEMEKTREADERMRIMLDSTPFGTHFWDRDHNLIDCNRATLNLFKLKHKQEFLDKFYDFSPEFQPDGRPSKDASVEAFKTACDEGYNRFEWLHQADDGEPIPCEMTLVRVDYEDGFNIVGYIRDLRAQKQMIQEINETAARLKAVVTNYSGTIWSVDRENTITLFDGQHLKTVGMSPHFLEGKHLYQALKINRHLDIIENVEKTFAGEPQDWISEIDGRLYRSRTAPIHDEDGNVTGIVGNMDDLTELLTLQKDLESALEKAEAAVQLNKVQLTKLNLVVQASKIGLWDMEVIKDDPINTKNAFIWSDEFRHMLGYANESDFPDLLGSWSDLLHPDDKDKTLDAFSRHLLDASGKTPFDIEYRLLRKDGNYAYYHASGDTIRDDAGNPVRVAGALVDITEAKNLLIDTERQRIEAEAANKAKSAFLSTMSHEIRTPMNAILGITEIQLQNDNLDKSLKEALGKIYASGDLLLGIINDILDLSKIEAGKLELNIAKYEIASLVSDTAQLNMMRIGSKPIEFELYVDENLPTLLMGDELRVKQILNNLLSNAFKYTAEGTVTLSVSAEIAEGSDDAANLVFSVSDTGQGMTPEQVAKLFDEYSRFNMEANRTTEGTGLGMSITRNLIRLMGGEIIIDSEPGRGSTFTVNLPQGRIGEDVLGAEMAENLHQFRTSNRAQMKRVQISREPMPYGSVLIVDDVETNIYVAQGLLTPYGLKIDSADSGFSAIDKIKDGSEYDIVFMDHMMPQMDGIEATQKIRAMGYKLPIVALTANAVAGQADVFLGNGFDDFISKPIDVRQLNVVLNKLIRDKQPPEVLEAARREAAEQHAAEQDGGPLSADGGGGRRDGDDTDWLTGGPAGHDVDPHFAEIFVRDALKALAILEEIRDTGGYGDEDNLRSYIINVHGMKSALANIKETELSAAALKLETAGREGLIGTIEADTPAFLASLRSFVGTIMPAPDGDAGETDDEDPSLLREKLLELQAACEEYDEGAMEEALAELEGKAWSRPTKDLLSALAEHLLHSDFDEISQAISDRLEQG